MWLFSGDKKLAINLDKVDMLEDIGMGKLFYKIGDSKGVFHCGNIPFNMSGIITMMNHKAPLVVLTSKDELTENYRFDANDIDEDTGGLLKSAFSPIEEELAEEHRQED